MLLKIAQKWKIILLWMLILAAVLDGYAAAKSYRDSIAAQNASSQTTDAASYKKNLSTDKAEAVEQAYGVYKQYQSSYHAVEKYCNESVKMQIDHTKVPTVTLLYHVTNFRNVTELCTLINTSIFTDEWLKEVRNELGWEKVEISYLSELISASEIDDQDDQTGKVFKVKVISKDKESAERIAGLAKQEIADQMPLIKEKYPAAAIRELNQNFEYAVDGNLLSDQQWNMEKMNNCFNIINNLANNFDDDQKNYYHALIDSDDADSAEQTVEKGQAKPQVSIINPKYILLGMAAGLFLLCCYYACLYLFSKRLHSVSEMEAGLGISVIGTRKQHDIEGETVKRRKIHRFSGDKKQMTYEQWMQVVCMKIKLALDKNNIHTLLVTSTTDSEEIDRIKTDLQQCVKDFDYQVVFGNSVVYDADALAELLKADGVLFLEKVDQSIYDDVVREIELCRENDIFILGTVIIE